MDKKTIKDTLVKGERVTLECKRAMSEVPKSVWATYSAFANTIGGLILLGVDEIMQEKDTLKRYQVIGVENPMKIVSDFISAIMKVTTTARKDKYGQWFVTHLRKATTD